MSPLHFVIMLIIAIAILTVLTLKFKMHPVMVLVFDRHILWFGLRNVPCRHLC